MLLLEKTWVQFPAPIWQCTAACASSSRGSRALFWPWASKAHGIHTYIQASTHTITSIFFLVKIYCYMFSSKYYMVGSHLCYSVSNWTNGVQVCFTLAILRLLYVIFIASNTLELLGVSVFTIVMSCWLGPFGIVKWPLGLRILFSKSALFEMNITLQLPLAWSYSLFTFFLSLRVFFPGVHFL